MADLPPNLLDAVIQTESSGTPDAYNPKSGATGLGQITIPALTEFNQYNKANYKMSDMKDPNKNMLVSSWYLTKRIPSMLMAYNLPLTLDNVLSAYNFGIGNVKSGKKLPKETVDYIGRVKKNLETMNKSQVGGI